MTEDRRGRPSITLVPHTHWDREWYEPFAVFSERLVVMMEGLLDLVADGFPHFHLDGQTAMIDDYLARRPERAGEVEAAVRSGRLSAGPWVAQMDEFLTSGESHIRNLEMGLARASQLGRPLRIGYMPDQFGHIGQMPQILRLCGLDRAMVWRGVPAAIDRSTFRWRSPDGSEVLTEYMVFGYFNGEGLDQAIEPSDLAAALDRSVESMQPYLAGDAMVVMVGYDHAGPDATLSARLSAARALSPGTRARIGGLESHIAAIDGAAVDGLPTWTGELRSSARAQLLPNVYSARVHQKRERGRVEALLERYAEPLAALVPGMRWPQEELDRAWTLMLHNGAHDSACGCSHDQVAVDVDERFATARAIAETIVAEALEALGGRVDRSGTVRFNPSPFEREGVPPLGYAVVEGDPATHRLGPRPSPIAAAGDGTAVVIDGALISLLDEPDVGDLYNYCYAEPGQSPTPPDAIQIGDGRFEAVWPGLRISLRVTRAPDEPFVRLDGWIDNDRHDHRVRLQVPLLEQVDRSMAGSPFEMVARPLVGEGSSIEAASPTWPARHVVHAGSSAVFHEGVFEYEVVEGRVLAITLLRSVGVLSAQTLATRPWEAGPATPTPAAQMVGRTPVSLGLWIDGAPEDPALLLEAWERFALPLVEAPAPGGVSLAPSGSLAPVEVGSGTQLSNVRRVGRAVQVRMWNPSTARHSEAVVSGRPIRLGPARIEAVTIEPG